LPADRESKRPTIECAPNGPYLVRNLESFRNSAGDAIPVRRSMALCRCGASKNKPFCDGSHERMGFSSEKREGRVEDRRDVYQGERISIYDNRGICSHAGFCTDGCPHVWRMKTEPWIEPDGAEVERIVETIEKCPSGALSYALDGVEHRDRERDPAIHISKNGPYRVEGGVELLSEARGEGASCEHYTLCRCGGSKNKPFCDGTHWYVDFQDDESKTRPGADDAAETKLAWYRVGDVGFVPDGSVVTVTAGTAAVALAHVDGRYSALCNHCPHQGGPLGEGTIENGVLRCPWHGWDFDPLTGRGTGDHADHVPVYPCEVREDGIYVGIEESIEHVRTVSDVMAETMVNWGVDSVFGIVGHSNLGLADALRIQEKEGRLRFFGVRHEGAAAFAASGYAKLTGRPAACLGIAGPGSTNLLTGLWDAKVDRAPVLALSGQVQTQVFGPGAFQDIDLASAFEAVSRFSQTVLPESRHAELMTLALKNAVVERDVAHLVFPDEVQVLRAADGAMASGPEGRVGASKIAPPPAELERAVACIRQARRPVVIVGYGARDGMDGVIQLAERLKAPVVTTFKAKAQIPDDHPLAAGVLGRSGTPVASWLMNEADLLVVFGASFSAHTGIDRRKDIVQVDFDRMALGKFHPVAVPVWGDIAISADRIRESLPADPGSVDQRPEVAERWALWREEKRRREAEERGKGVNSAAIFAALTRQAPEDAVIAVDVGNNTYSFGRYFESKHQRVLMSGYLGSIGFAFPAAMGAWAANSGRPILSVGGDGGFGQYLGEFTTAVKYGMNITHVLLNNNELGKISKEQRAGEWEVWQTSLHNPDFSEFARLCGGHGARVTKAADLDGALADAIAHEGPALVEIVSDVELI
jgi:thiamine pyrophosphate-dependent acetolactate synthase large subunit-like protein/CDGSH-type Zn-finger protein